jgi:ActR/RegA family two-component response regulator
MIVEDDEAWAASLKGKLKGEFEVSHYTSGEDAIQNLAALKPKIVVLDYHLEGQMTGLDTLKEIKRLLPKAKVIMFSAQDDVQVAVNILNNGAYDYVVKGENATNRLNIILRNLSEIEHLESQVVKLSVKVRRDRLWMGILIVGLLIGSMVIYFTTCPSQRAIKWDPFGVMDEQGNCSTYDNSTPNITPLNRLEQQMRAPDAPPADSGATPQ